MVQGEEGGEDGLFGLGAALGQRVGLGVGGRQGLARAGFFEDLGPGGVPAALGIGGGVRAQHGAVQGGVGEAEPGGAFVVEVGKRAFFEAGIAGGERVDGGLPDEAAGFLAADAGDIGEAVGRIDFGGDLGDPLGRVEPAFALVVEGLGGGGDGVVEGAMLGALGRFVAGGPGEGEGLEAGGGRVARVPG